MSLLIRNYNSKKIENITLLYIALYFVTENFKNNLEERLDQSDDFTAKTKFYVNINQALLKISPSTHPRHWRENN